MNLKIHNYDGLSILIAEGSVEEAGLREMAEALDRLPLAAEKFVLLDCADLTKLIHSSIGFSGFISHLLYYRSKPARVVLLGCDQQAQKLLRVLRLENAFSYAPTLDEAYLRLRKGLQPVGATGEATPKITYA